MAKLQNFNGRFCESDFEAAFISFLENVGWSYLPGKSFVRNKKRDVLYQDDFLEFIAKTNPDFTAEDASKFFDNISLVGADSEFATLHKVYNWMVDGVLFTTEKNITSTIALIDFETPSNNIFRVVNQLSVEYRNNGKVENRRPDILLYVNGLPLCVIELKNPADANATIYDAWEQIIVRYWRDIPHLLHYCPLACISDGVNTRLGAVRTFMNIFMLGVE